MGKRPEVGLHLEEWLERVGTLPQKIIVGHSTQLSVLQAAVTHHSQGSGDRTRLRDPMMRYIIDRSIPGLQLSLSELLEYTSINISLDLGIVDLPSLVMG